MALTTCEIIWLCWLLEDMGIYLKDPTPLHYDNKSVIYIVRNSVFHERTKHIETDCILLIIFNLALYLQFVPSALQITYIFTKVTFRFTLSFFI